MHQKSPAKAKTENETNSEIYTIHDITTDPSPPAQQWRGSAGVGPAGMSARAGQGDGEVVHLSRGRVGPRGLRSPRAFLHKRLLNRACARVRRPVLPGTLLQRGQGHFHVEECPLGPSVDRYQGALPEVIDSGPCVLTENTVYILMF